MSEIDNRQHWVFDECTKQFNNKERMQRFHLFNMLNRTTQMFKYSGLPDTITVKDLETYLQVNGFAIWAKVNGKLYVFFGGLGGEPNPYYLPTKAIVANPALKYSKSLNISDLDDEDFNEETDCVVMLNDHYYVGLVPLFNKYADLLTTAEITLKFALVNARIPALINAKDDNTKMDAEKFLEKVVNGEQFGIIGSDDFDDETLKTYPFASVGSGSTIKDSIEAIQYLKGSWFNEIGLNSAFNMKREAINESEATINDNILFPTIDTMLEMRRKGLERVNAKFGTNITVELNSSWKYNEEVERLTLDEMETQAQGGDDVGETESAENTDNSGSSVTD